MTGILARAIERTGGGDLRAVKGQDGVNIAWLCAASHAEGVWWPKFPKAAYWRRLPKGGEGVRKRIRCPACRRRMPAELHTRVETVEGGVAQNGKGWVPAERAGQLVAFLFEYPEH